MNEDETGHLFIADIKVNEKKKKKKKRTKKKSSFQLNLYYNI